MPATTSSPWAFGKYSAETTFSSVLGSREKATPVPLVSPVFLFYCEIKRKDRAYKSLPSTNFPKSYTSFCIEHPVNITINANIDKM